MGAPAYPDTDDYTNAAPITRYIKVLQQAGMSLHDIAAASHVSFSTVQSLAKGRYHRTLRVVALAILIVRNPGE